jgi:hypothetical protein
MRTVTVQLRADDVIGTTDRRLFGAFIEHLGRCVYGGIFEPGHPSADGHGFRGDVLALVRESRANSARESKPSTSLDERCSFGNLTRISSLIANPSLP